METIGELKNLVEQARLIVEVCEASKFDRGDEYGKVSDELTAYGQLKELFLPDRRDR